METTHHSKRKHKRKRPSDDVESPVFATRRAHPTPESSKWTAEQELQLVKVRQNCLAHQWMHYRMARLRGIFAALLGFPLVVLAALSTAAQFFAELGDDCSSGSEELTVGGTIAIVMATLVTIFTGLNSWLKPSETAELHRQASISYRGLVTGIEQEAACSEDDRELGRVFLKEIESQVELLEQNAPNIHWFIMKNYLTDYADDRGPSFGADNRMGHSLSVRLDRGEHEDDSDYNLMDNFKLRLKSRLELERQATRKWEMERGAEEENADAQ